MWGKSLGRKLRQDGCVIANLELPNHLSHCLNLLTPNVNYSGRTAPLTSKVAFYIFIQQI